MRKLIVLTMLLFGAFNAQAQSRGLVVTAQSVHNLDGRYRANGEYWKYDNNSVGIHYTAESNKRWFYSIGVFNNSWSKPSVLGIVGKRFWRFGVGAGFATNYVETTKRFWNKSHGVVPMPILDYTQPIGKKSSIVVTRGYGVSTIGIKIKL